MGETALAYPVVIYSVKKILSPEVGDLIRHPGWGSNYYRVIAIEKSWVKLEWRDPSGKIRSAGYPIFPDDWEWEFLKEVKEGASEETFDWEYPFEMGFGDEW